MFTVNLLIQYFFKKIGDLTLVFAHSLTPPLLWCFLKQLFAPFQVFSLAAGFGGILFWTAHRVPCDKHFKKAEVRWIIKGNASSASNTLTHCTIEVLYKLEYKPCHHFPLKLEKAKEVLHFEMLLSVFIGAIMYSCLFKAFRVDGSCSAFWGTTVQTPFSSVMRACVNFFFFDQTLWTFQW